MSGKIKVFQLTEDDKLRMYKLWYNNDLTFTAIGIRFSVDRRTVSRAIYYIADKLQMPVD